MQVPVKISAHRFHLTPDLEEMIRERAERLERFDPHLTRCEVVVNGFSAHHQTGGPVAVRVHLGVRGDELTVDRQHAESLEVAVREAFDAARRQLQDFVRLQRGKVKTHEEQPEGRVVRLFPDRGYGFLETAEGREVYFHANSVLDPGFDALEVGCTVRFTMEQGHEGPQASSLSIVEAPEPEPVSP